jgi:hypothetical protein
MSTEFCREFAITKTDDEQRVVYGWASVISEKGIPTIDTQGDIIEAADLTKAAHNFMLDSRAGKLMHQGGKIAEVVESALFTSEMQKSLGIDLGKEGWYIGMKILKEDLWTRIKAGEFPAFSIGGRAHRVPVEGAK